MIENLVHPMHNWTVILDVLIVYLLIYYFLLWLKNNHSFNLVRGLFLVLVLVLLSHLLGLATLNWLLEKFTDVLILIVIILFHPEIRRVLEKLGRKKLFSQVVRTEEGQGAAVIKHILRAVDTLSRQKIGGLIVIEMTNNLDEYTQSGIAVDANLSSELVVALFWPNCPTHDGAIVIRHNKIISAECLLPLTDSRLTDRRLGTRHRAALGLSELTDALIIVISEETGIISLAENGNLTRFLNREALEARLFNLYSEESSQELPVVSWMNRGLLRVKTALFKEENR